MYTVVVFDKNTHDIIAMIPLKDGETAVCRNDVGYEIYNGVEPVITETPTGPKLKKNAFYLMPGGVNDDR